MQARGSPGPIGPGLRTIPFAGRVRSVAVERLIERLGKLDTALVEEIVAGIVIGVDYRP